MGGLSDYSTYVVWALGGLGAFLFALAAAYFAPARTMILVDTAGSAARAEMRLLWGFGPKVTARALPRAATGHPLEIFNDAPRIGYALMTPGIAEAAYEVVRSLWVLRPRVSRVSLGLNLAESSQNLVVQTAAQAAIAAAPSALRDNIIVQRCEAPGADFSASFELMASPAQLGAIWGRFKSSRSVREFRKRLKRAPKPSKKAPKEVRAA